MISGQRQLCVVKIDGFLICQDYNKDRIEETPSKYKNGIKLVNTNQYKTCVVTESNKLKCFS